MGKINRKIGLFGAVIALGGLCSLLPASPASAAVSYVTQWGSLGSAPGQFGGPIGLAASPSGTVFVSDQFSGASTFVRVQRFSPAGAFETEWGSLGVLPGQFTNPGAIATSPSGHVYVGDYSLNRIQRFDADGNLLGSWGTGGSGNGQFAAPWGIAIDPQGRVYVVDYGNNRIQKFGPTGNFLDQWGSFGSGNGQFLAASFVAADSKGHVYVADSGNSRIQKFTTGGKYLDQWASPGPGAGVPDFPLGIATDPQGDVFVVGTNSIQKYGPTGTLLTKWGKFGKGNGQFRNPQGIATDASGNVYVGDSGNSRVQKFHDPGPPYPDPGTARLGLRSAGSIEIRGGRTGVLPVRVRNTGSNPVRNVRICAPRSARASRLIRAVNCRRLGSIGVGEQRTARLEVSVRCLSARRVNLGLRASASNAPARTGAATIRITDCRVRPAPRPPFPWEGLG